MAGALGGLATLSAGSPAGGPFHIIGAAPRRSNAKGIIAWSVRRAAFCRIGFARHLERRSGSTGLRRNDRGRAAGRQRHDRDQPLRSRGDRPGCGVRNDDHDQQSRRRRGRNGLGHLRACPQPVPIPARSSNSRPESKARPTDRDRGPAADRGDRRRARRDRDRDRVHRLRGVATRCRRQGGE